MQPNKSKRAVVLRAVRTKIVSRRSKEGAAKVGISSVKVELAEDEVLL